MISTRSPGADSFASSCTWQTVLLCKIRPYFGWRIIRGISTRRVLLAAALVTVPVSTFFGIPVCPSGLVPLITFLFFVD